MALDIEVQQHVASSFVVVESKLVATTTTIGVQELHLVDLGNPQPLVELEHLAI
jgi:hypothetical protein